ncbi:hypothetical protein [Thalassospira sp. TSL5-1]|uniref:hypothetical protein n=1 Tax=Thalassospira sp. TSL5-1 TaxID=1544451 RepID=UPI00116145AA|nr:hypothetical protein [Thalassospira sp. TSL5-1]
MADAVSGNKTPLCCKAETSACSVWGREAVGLLMPSFEAALICVLNFAKASVPQETKVTSGC